MTKISVAAVFSIFAFVQPSWAELVQLNCVIDTFGPQGLIFSDQEPLEINTSSNWVRYAQWDWAPIRQQDENYLIWWADGTADYHVAVFSLNLKTGFLQVASVHPDLETNSNLLLEDGRTGSEYESRIICSRRLL